jgi:hypothetical protein
MGHPSLRYVNVIALAEVSSRRMHSRKAKRLKRGHPPRGQETITYGPFLNAAGGGDVPQGADVYIVIVLPR